MKLDFLATEEQYEAHLAPIYDELPERYRGDMLHRARSGDRPVLVTSGQDSRVCRVLGRPVIRMEHGVGQSYPDDAPGHEGYPGGLNQEHALMFLAPNEIAADRWRVAYPETPSFAIGCPKLDRWHRFPPPAVLHEPHDPPVVAVSFSWDCSISADTRSVFWEFREAVEELLDREDIELLGHRHPRATSIDGWWRELGVEHTDRFEDVLLRADLYVSENSSTLFEFASLDRPVVRLRGRHQRAFEPPYAGVGISTDPVSLDEAISWALDDDELTREARHATVDALYPHRGNATFTAIDLIMKEIA